MTTTIRPPWEVDVVVPPDADTLDGFRRWVASDDFPDRGNITYIDGEVLIDMNAERVETHISVKAETDRVINTIARAQDRGKYYPDGLWLTNDDADLSTEPDGTFLTWESWNAGRVEFVSWHDDYEEEVDDRLEMRGSPDWLLEIVSPSSVRKDVVRLPAKYHKAGVDEYWLIDARDDALQFTIFHREPEEYAAAEPKHGWLFSRVFELWFKLEREQDPTGGWTYTLHHREDEPIT